MRKDRAEYMRGIREYNWIERYADRTVAFHDPRVYHNSVRDSWRVIVVVPGKRWVYRDEMGDDASGPLFFLEAVS